MTQHLKDSLADIHKGARVLVSCLPAAPVIRGRESVLIGLGTVIAITKRTLRVKMDVAGRYDKPVPYSLKDGTEWGRGQSYITEVIPVAPKEDPEDNALIRPGMLRLLSGDAEAWSKKHGLVAFTTDCDGCGALRTTTTPFAWGKERGLVAPNCLCGNTYPPYCVVGRIS